MKKEENGFISNPTMFAVLAILSGLTCCLLILIIIFEIHQIINNLFLIVILIILLSLIIFFIVLINKFTYRICFEENYVCQYKGKRLLNKFNINEVNMVFINSKYGYVNLEGVNIQGLRIILCFEYSKNRGEIIEKYFMREIENLPDRYK